VLQEEKRRKIRALIVDDEPLALGNLRVLLARDPGVEIVGECGSGMQALADIRKNKPELVFLDVQMPEVDGFDVLEQLGALMPPALVFVTAYDEYALRAFEAGALDYLLKPFDNVRFELTLERAKERIARGTAVPRTILLRFNERHALRTDNSVADNVRWLDFTHALTFGHALRQQCVRQRHLWPPGLL
jgi:two-component system LytT family response regulator